MPLQGFIDPTKLTAEEIADIRDMPGYQEHLRQVAVHNALPENASNQRTADTPQQYIVRQVLTALANYRAEAARARAGQGDGKRVFEAIMSGQAPVAKVDRIIAYAKQELGL
jgi:hypothetical protein